MGSTSRNPIKRTRLIIDDDLTYTAVGIIGGLIIWELLGMALTNMATFSDTVTTWLSLARDGTLLTATISSLQHMVVGLLIAVAVGIPLGFAMGRIKPLYWALDPPLSALYATPVVALIPLIVVWFGLNFKAKVFIVFLMSFIELVVNVYQGVFEIPEGYTDTASSFGASKLETYTSVLIPASAPFITAGLRLSIGRAVRGMITAEIFLAASGIGEILLSSSASFNIAIQLAAIGTVTCIGIVAQSMVKYADNYLIHWG